MPLLWQRRAVTGGAKNNLSASRVRVGTRRDADLRRSPQGTQVSGFTLIELATLLAVMAIAGALLVPALARTRPQFKVLQCMNNQRQLMRAWQLYAQDSSEALANNFGASETLQTVASGSYLTWANNVLDWTTATMNTNLSLVRRGPLAEYAGRDPRLFRCPADVYLSSVQRAAKWPGRTRTYSMNGFFGPYSLDPTSSWAKGYNQFFTTYRQWIKVAQVLKPAGSFVLIEEHPDSVNDGYFINNPVTTGSWGDIPASVHQGSCNVAFADGHIECHKWLSATTRIPVRFFYSSVALDPGGRIDYQWLMSRAATR